MKYALTEVIEGILGHPVPERSQNAMVRCPFHADDRPSLSIDLDRGVWVCFGCGEKGGIHKLARKMETEVDEVDVAIRMAGASSGPYYEEPQDFSALAYDLHQGAIRTRPGDIVAYLEQKLGVVPNRSGIRESADLFRHFRLGWDGERGVMAMPYFDDDRVVAIKYRGQDGFKFYEKGSRRTIYNLNEVRGVQSVILCEGESDTHRVWLEARRRGLNLGVGGVPGVGEGQPSRSQWELWSLDLIWSERVFIAFDADEAGDKGAVTAMQTLGEKAVRIRPTRGKDMLEHLQRGGDLGELGLGEADASARLPA